MIEERDFEILADRLKAYRVTGFAAITWEIDPASAAKLELALRGMARWRKLVAETEARLDARQAALDAQAWRLSVLGGCGAVAWALALALLWWLP